MASDWSSGDTCPLLVTSSPFSPLGISRLAKPNSACSVRIRSRRVCFVIGGCPSSSAGSAFFTAGAAAVLEVLMVFGSSIAESAGTAREKLRTMEAKEKIRYDCITNLRTQTAPAEEAGFIGLIIRLFSRKSNIYLASLGCKLAAGTRRTTLDSAGPGPQSGLRH